MTQIVFHMYLNRKFRLEHRKKNKTNIYVIFMIFDIGIN